MRGVSRHALVAAAVAALATPALACAQSSAEPALNDAAIAHIGVTANAIDVEIAELAPTRASDARVKAFAETMVRDHNAVNAQAAELAKRLGVTPADNDVSKSLRSDAAAVKERLTGLQGAAFDRAYMEREVAYHQTVLDALDKTLIPNTKNAELKALLQQARQAVAAHLEHARQLKASVGGE